MSEATENVAKLRNATASNRNEEETVTSTKTTTEETIKPGFFTLLLDKLRANPIKTALGASTVVVVGVVGGNNYLRTGSPVPRRNDTVVKVAGLATSLFGGR